MERFVLNEGTVVKIAGFPIRLLGKVEVSSSIDLDELLAICADGSGDDPQPMLVSENP